MHTLLAGSKYQKHKTRRNTYFAPPALLHRAFPLHLSGIPSHLSQLSSSLTCMDTDTPHTSKHTYSVQCQGNFGCSTTTAPSKTVLVDRLPGSHKLPGGWAHTLKLYGNMNVSARPLPKLRNTQSWKSAGAGSEPLGHAAARPSLQVKKTFPLARSLSSQSLAMERTNG